MPAAAPPSPSRAVTGVPIKFLGTSEKVDGIEVFHPDRLASRILGMGDVLTMIEKAEATMDQAEAVRMEKKLRTCLLRPRGLPQADATDQEDGSSDGPVGDDSRHRSHGQGT